ncbi:hypothetical protein SAMN04488589_2094 [Methanolobus vulcani]|uniref:Uncharacterized protein n=1 Tax=Methanolobus vulcani TaxID=38026 RepID=A0A7Z7B028_9EURY|nr:hypothetical protein SAMN04488589_2094 [Methanolobus vulcani]
MPKLNLGVVMKLKRVVSEAITYAIIVLVLYYTGNWDNLGIVTLAYIISIVFWEATKA